MLQHRNSVIVTDISATSAVVLKDSTNVSVTCTVSGITTASILGWKLDVSDSDIIQSGSSSTDRNASVVVEALSGANQKSELVFKKCQEDTVVYCVANLTEWGDSNKVVSGSLDVFGKF